MFCFIFCFWGGVDDEGEGGVAAPLSLCSVSAAKIIWDFQPCSPCSGDRVSLLVKF